MRILSAGGLGDEFGIETGAGETGEGTASQAASTPTLYPSLELATADEDRTLTSTILTGGIVRVLEKTALNDESWVQVRLCSLPFGNDLSDTPTEEGVSREGNADNTSSNSGPDDTPQPFNQPESIEEGQPLIMEPGQDGWMLESELAAIAQNMTEVEASQKGRCEG